MHAITSLIQGNILFAWLGIIVGFAILAKCADIFVDTAVTIAYKFNTPKLIVGIVLVSLATTMPELTVSVLAALRGQPEMALGNAIGSVICDDGVALAAAGIFSVAPIAVMPKVLKSSGLFLIFIQVVAFLFVAFDSTLSRNEGFVLVGLFATYMYTLIRRHRIGDTADGDDEANPKEELLGRPLIIIFGLFVLGLAGIIFSSEIVVTSATSIARIFRIPETIIATTLVALGTSIPEIATCIVAARKKQGAIAIGNIIGADILNITWIAGASAVVNDLTVARKDIFFMFPSMFVIVGAMLLMLRSGYTLTRKKGFVLLGLYGAFLVLSVILYPPGS